MVLKLHGYPLSNFTQKVLLTLVETGTPYEFVLVELPKGATYSAEYTALNPFGAVPCIDDDGFVLYESNAISRYIAAKARSPLVPAAGDLRANARFDQALSVEQSRIDATIQPLLFQRVWTPRFTGAAADEARVQELAQTLEKRLAAYDAILGRQRYLAGESVTVVDLNHLSFGVYLAPQGFTWLEDKEKFPNVARWWAEISARPAWKEVQRLVQEMVPLYAESLKPHA